MPRAIVTASWGSCPGRVYFHPEAAAAAPKKAITHAVADKVNQLVSTRVIEKGFKVTGEGYFAKVGMRCLHLFKKGNVVPTIHVERLWSLVSEQSR